MLAKAFRNVCASMVLVAAGLFKRQAVLVADLTQYAFTEGLIVGDGVALVRAQHEAAWSIVIVESFATVSSNGAAQVFNRYTSLR